MLNFRGWGGGGTSPPGPPRGFTPGYCRFAFADSIAI